MALRRWIREEWLVFILAPLVPLRISDIEEADYALAAPGNAPLTIFFDEPAQGVIARSICRARSETEVRYRVAGEMAARAAFSAEMEAQAATIAERHGVTLVAIGED